jgi:ribosomal protein S18 acetylase RimI-like enzyme
MSCHRIRAATPPDLPALAATNIACWRETYDALLPAAFLQDLEADSHCSLDHWRELVTRWRILLVERDVEPDPAREIAGFVLFADSSGTLPGFDAQIEKLHLRRSAQGLGLGRRLMQAAAGDLPAMGRHALVIWVIDRNEPAKRFYERLGGVRVGEPLSFTVGPLERHEIAFAWPRLDRLVIAL